MDKNVNNDVSKDPPIRIWPFHNSLTGSLTGVVGSNLKERGRAIAGDG